MLFIWLSAWVPHAETMKLFCVYDLYWCPWQGENLGGLCWDGFEGLEGGCLLPCTAPRFGWRGCLLQHLGTKQRSEELT